MSPGEEGKRVQGECRGGMQSRELSFGGLISSTRRTTGDEVFFRLATASLRVTPVSSTPFTFRRMSPRRQNSHFIIVITGLLLHGKVV